MNYEINGIILAMWGEPEEEIAREVVSRFDVSFEKAMELVALSIAEELSYYEPDEAQEWYDFDPDC